MFACAYGGDVGRFVWCILTFGRSCRCTNVVVASACTPVSPLGSAPRLDVRRRRDRVFCAGDLFEELNRRGTAGISSLCRVDILLWYGCPVSHVPWNARLYRGGREMLHCRERAREKEHRNAGFCEMVIKLPPFVTLLQLLLPPQTPPVVFSHMSSPSDLRTSVRRGMNSIYSLVPIKSFATKHP